MTARGDGATVIQQPARTVTVGADDRGDASTGAAAAPGRARSALAAVLGTLAVLLLVVLNVGASLAETTANLLAPILVTHDRRACQVVLEDGSHPVAAPLVA